MCTLSPGSATSIDLAALEQLARAATPDEWLARPYGRLIGGPLRHYVNGSAQAQIASFNVTLHDQSPDDEPERQQANTKFVAAFSPPTALALIALARATPQHSVTEQASIDRDAFWVLISELKNARPGHDYRQASAALVRYITEWADNRAQPPASTAATQPERPAGADPEFMKFWRADHRPSINNIGSFSHVAVYYIWNAGRRAALAILASTAASEQQAGADERERFEEWARKECNMPASAKVNWKAQWTRDSWYAWQAALTHRATTADSAHLRILLSIIYAAGVAKMDATDDYERVIAYVSGRATTAAPGYKWVPIEPTDAMAAAAIGASLAEPEVINGLPQYKAMLAAAPDIATTAADQQGDTASASDDLNDIPRYSLHHTDQGGAMRVRGDGEYVKLRDVEAVLRAQQGAAQAQAGDSVDCPECGFGLAHNPGCVRALATKKGES